MIWNIKHDFLINALEKYCDREFPQLVQVVATSLLGVHSTYAHDEDVQTYEPLIEGFANEYQVWKNTKCGHNSHTEFIVLFEVSDSNVRKEMKVFVTDYEFVDKDDFLEIKKAHITT